MEGSVDNEAEQDGMDIDWEEDESDVGEALNKDIAESTGTMLRGAKVTRTISLATTEAAMLDCVMLIETASEEPANLVNALKSDRRAASTAAARSATKAPAPSRQASATPAAEPGMVRKRQRPKAEDMFASDEE